MSEQLMILVAGPYRGGTNDDPVLIQRNVDAMEEMSLAVFRRGHLPVMGEWFALPLLKQAGSKKIGDAVFDEIFHPIARELIGKCDAVLRIGGPSAGADDMVTTGERLGKRIFHDLSEIPRTVEALKGHWFAPYFTRLVEALKDIAKDYGKWTDKASFEVIGAPLGLLDQGGVRYTSRPDGRLRIDIPFTAETMPSEVEAAKFAAR